MIFIILLMVVFGRNILLLFFAIGAVEWLTMARIVRSQVMALRNQEFVEAAQLLGAFAVDYYPSPHHTKYSWTRDCLHYPHHSKCNVTRSFLELF